MKLLEKMGYKGGGLGRNEQGIVDPIEAKVRPKAMGLGYKDHKEVSFPKVEKFQESKSFPDAIQCTEKHTKGKFRSKQARFKKKRNFVSKEFRVWKEETELERKVVQTVLNLNAEAKGRENDSLMPKLSWNVKLSVDIVEHHIQKLDQDLGDERETVISLQQKEKLTEEAIYKQKQLDDLEEIVSVLDCIDVESKAGTLTLTSLANTFGDLQTRFAGHYKLRSLSGIACSFALPLFIRYFRRWDPLQNPTYGLEVVSLWKNLLQADLPDYTQIFIKVVLPALRISGINNWQAREPEPMIRFLESWEDLLPISIRQSILDTVVMPSLSAAVDSWEPRWETVPIHLWVHPWLPWLHQKSDIICQKICARFRSALHAWQPNDMSIYHKLLPWKTTFGPTSWERLLVRYIKPKLLSIMNEFQVDPANKNQLQWVFIWATAFPINHMLDLMDVFFDKWQAVLYHWLCQEPNFEKLISWFLCWKNLIPPELLATDRIRSRLKVGLNMMDKASEGRKVVKPMNKQRQFKAQEDEKIGAQQAFNSFCRKTRMEDIDGGHEMSLKEIIEFQAQQNGLIFKPKPGRTQDGHQIYGFGNVSLIIDTSNEKVSAQIEDKWSLLSSFDQLLELHNRSGQKQH